MKYLLLFVLLISTGTKKTFAQSQQADLTFNKKLIESLDKWVALPMSKDSTYTYGFIYLDDVAGLTFHNEGTFKIIDHKLINVNKRSMMQRLIERISPSNLKVAVIPNGKFKELEILKSPDWLKNYYSQGPNSLSHLFRLGNTYNHWSDPASALPYLEAVKKINPNYKGLAYEFAYSYNALKQYDKALEILADAIKINPKDCDLYKEVMYAQMNLKEIDRAMETVKTALTVCNDKASREPMLRDLVYYYFNKKDKEQFKIWAEKAKKEIADNPQALQVITKWETELK